MAISVYRIERHLVLPQCDGLFQPVEAPGEDGRLPMMSGLAGSTASATSKCRAAAAKSVSKYIAMEPRWACAGPCLGSSASALLAASLARRAVSSGRAPATPLG